MRTWCVCTLAALAWLTGPVPGRAQQTERVEFVGTLSVPGGGPTEGYRVALVDPWRERPSREAEVDVQGWFTFQGVIPGEYTLEVQDGRGQTVYSETHRIQRSAAVCEIRVSGSSDATGPRPDAPTISLTRLSHKPAKQARKQFARAAKAAARGDNVKAAEFYERAVAADPDWFEARVNLAVQYYRTARFAEALTHLHKALELDPDSAIAYSNLSLVLLTVLDDSEAERAARRSVELNPFRAVGRYLLGLSLARLGRLEEALTELRLAAPEMPAAREMLNLVTAAARR